MAADSNNEPRPLALIVVVDPVMQQICRETLGGAGFVVIDNVESGAAAVVRAREQHTSIILLSQQLSDVPAPEAVKWLRSNRESANTPIIILGGKPDGAKNTTQVTVLPRPITAGQLQQALADAFDPNHRTRGALP